MADSYIKYSMLRDVAIYQLQLILSREIQRDPADTPSNVSLAEQVEKALQLIKYFDDQISKANG